MKRVYALSFGLLLGSCTKHHEMIAEGVEPGDEACKGEEPLVAKRWAGKDEGGCIFASLLHYESKSGSQVIAARGDGRVMALDPNNGETIWELELPARKDELAHVVATPVITSDRRMVIAWQDVKKTSGNPSAALRLSHRVALIDLEKHALDEEFPIVELEAEKPDFDGKEMIPFAPNNALSRSRLVHANAKGSKRGLAYVSFGNVRDIQPWHGWMFELDLDAWHDSGAKSAISSVLLTTPESDCGKEGESGSDDMICGGGIWAPYGPELVETGEGTFDLLVPTGNGALDLDRKDYAHTIMRVPGNGLKFEDGCDPVACADWDVRAPTDECLSSCQNLFIPRLLPGDPPFDVPKCEGLSFFECYAILDWDLGANSPAVVDIPEGPRALVLPAKDGGVYLFDYEHFGLLYDRLSIVEPCGADGATCKALWAGMMVTRPEVTKVDGEWMAVISTFNFDDQHPAGLVGVRIVMKDGAPRLEKAWEAPAFDEDKLTFRSHPSGVRLIEYEGEQYAVLVEQRGYSKQLGALYVVRVADGKVMQRRALSGPGQRFAQPLAIDDKIFIASCVDGNKGPSHVEAFRFQQCPID